MTSSSRSAIALVKDNMQYLNLKLRNGESGLLVVLVSCAGCSRNKIIAFFIRALSRTNFSISRPA